MILTIRTVRRAEVQPTPIKVEPMEVRRAARRYAAFAINAAVSALANFSGTWPSTSTILSFEYGTDISKTVADAPGTVSSSAAACAQRSCFQNYINVLGQFYPVRACSHWTFQINFGLRQHNCYQKVNLTAVHTDESSYIARRSRFFMKYSCRIVL